MNMSHYEAIHHLLANYCFIVDRASATEMADLFWEDATLDFAGEVYEGRDAIYDVYATWITEKRDPVVGLRHILYTPSIEVSGTSAVAETYYDADGHSKDSGRYIRLRGLYRDRLELRNAEWRFLSREVQTWQVPFDRKKS